MENEGLGFITVSVRTAGGALPVEGVLITITDRGGNAVAVMITDSGGVSDIVSLPTPPASNSLTPNSGEVNSLYNLSTEMIGYYPVVISGIPIFEGITTLQQILLVPIAAGLGIPAPNELTRFNEANESSTL